MAEIVVRNIILPYKQPMSDAIESAITRVKGIIPRSSIESAVISRRSVDARKKNDIKFIYSVLLKTSSEPVGDLLRPLDSSLIDNAPVSVPQGSETLGGRPLIVGMGPCGMFAALTLAKRGYAPIVIERGKDVFARKADIERFFNERILNEDSNIQFGAGGAGTFSDGKLITRINDSNCRRVLLELVRLGAPDEILWQAKPHIGTDKLLGIVENAEKEITALGGEIHYGTKLENIEQCKDGVIAKTSVGDIKAPLCLLALGHSARDTYKSLINSGFTVVPKDFSIGVRIEHLASDIDYAMYGNADLSVLGHAEYTLSHREGDSGVYTFCMCPGGQVIAAASEKGGVVVNGMSNYKRDFKNSNSAVAVSIHKEDYGNDPMKAIEFQRSIEKKAFELGGKDYSVPVQSVGCFMGKCKRTEIKRVVPSYMNGNAYRVADLSSGLPPYVVSMLKTGLSYFEREIRGFSSLDAVLSGYETRTSSPLRITRSDDMRAIGHRCIMPCGEGAGYAGGITSAAADGIRAAEKIIAEFSPFSDK